MALFDANKYTVKVKDYHATNAQAERAGRLKRYTDETAANKENEEKDLTSDAQAISKH